MKCRPSLSARLWLGALSLALLAMLAAWLAAWGAGRLHGYASEALAARSRTEAYAAFQAREGEWLFGWLTSALVRDSAGQSQTMPQPPDPGPVLAALDLLDQLVAGDLAGQAGVVAGPGSIHLTPARLRALFQGLETALQNAPPDSPTGQMALNYHAIRAQPLLLRALEQERQRHDEALAAMEDLRQPLRLTAALIALAAPLVLAGLYLTVLSPLFRRLREATRAAPELATGRLPPGAGGHDELGLMFARQRQMAARLGRRRSHLEQEVNARTADLAGANARLARIDSNRRRFFADVGHELRTPLTVILGEAELGAGHADPQVRASFATVSARAARLYRRTEDLLRIARSESGQLELQPGPVPLQACVEAALGDLLPVLRRAKITCHTDLPPLLLRADGEWLRQVFAGFFENSAKYAGAGAELRITALEGAPAGFVLLRIADNGQGLTPGAGKDPAQLLDRFARGTGSTGSGFGLGLALAHWVVEASGGRLSLVPMPQGQGFGLDLLLPLWEEG
ncbi:sensor histidine kinase [Pseudogemmobacter faecipullorum]|uniref:histidine kinase n=1 Tax=Pseudogemmobacter faecipullorum TaxID=2755041 RepID=A0ABS8CIL8_9RHOB|nr:HAMP domain-containing histidine kinase [Pseudogemmobacter faecipullorum]